MAVELAAACGPGPLFGPRPDTLLFLSRCGPQFLAFFLARLALAPDRLQVLLEVVGAVVVVDLLAGRDVLDGADIDTPLFLANVGFRIRFAGMVDVARDVLAHRTVDGPAAGDLEQVFVLDRVVLFLVAIEQRTEIPDDLRALLDVLCGEEAEPGSGAADSISLFRRNLGRGRLN